MDQDGCERENEIFTTSKVAQAQFLDTPLLREREGSTLTRMFV